MTARRPTPTRTTIRRLPDKAVRDRAALDQLLAQALVAHVAVVDDEGQPFVIPMAFAPDGDRILLHGSSASRLTRALAAGAATCVTVTALDAMVLARSQFESSMQYRSALILGRCAALDGTEKAAALTTLTEHLMPGRSAEARPGSTKELAATTMLAMPLLEWSLKVSNKEPEDDEADLDRPVWAGVIPVQHSFGGPVPASDLREAYPVPEYIRNWPTGRS